MEVSDRFSAQLVSSVVVVVVTAGVAWYLLIKKKSSDEEKLELILKRLDGIRYDIEQLRVDIVNLQGKSARPAKSPSQLQLSRTSTSQPLFSINRSVSNVSIASSDDFTDANDEWEGNVTASTSREVAPPITTFAEIDALFGTESIQQCYDQLKGLYEGGQKDAEVSWRLAKACHELSNRTSNKDQKKDLLFEGQKYAMYGADSTENNFMAFKWAAIMTGQTTDYLGTKEKIEQSRTFKGYLDKALNIDGKEFSLLHLRGRYAFSVAGLSWLERKAAAVLYATPPTATYEEAIEDFLAAYAQKPEWIENLLFLARSYIEKKDKASAAKYLKEAEMIEPADDKEKELLQECAKLLAKC